SWFSLVFFSFQTKATPLKPVVQSKAAPRDVGPIRDQTHLDFLLELLNRPIRAQQQQRSSSESSEGGARTRHMTRRRPKKTNDTFVFVCLFVTL
ncbi:hypothetical protein WMY93_033812, partial [Mugilogobius chulae]